MHPFVEHKTVAGGSLALQGIEHIPATGFQPAAGQVEHLLRRLPGDDGFDLQSSGPTLQVTDHDIPSHSAIGQHFVQTVLLGGQLADERLPLTSD